MAIPATELESEIAQNEQTLASFIEEWQESITSKVIETYRPRYRPVDDERLLPELLRKPIGKQEQTIRGAALSLRTNRGTTVVGEMGTGKTYIGIGASEMAGFKRVIVLCPPHLVGKWKREIELTLPRANAAAVIVDSVTDLERVRAHYGRAKDGDPRTLYVVMSRERAKLSYEWRNTVHWHLPILNGRRIYTGPSWGDAEPLEKDDSDSGDALRYLPYCVECSQQLVDKDDVPLSERDVRMMRKRLSCMHCGAQLWQAHSGSRKTRRIGEIDYTQHRIGLAEYIQKKMRNFFDLFIADEVHEYKAKNSAQGIAAAALAQVCGRSLVLTGTLMGGYASTLFYLLYRFYPEFRDRFDYTGESQWVQRYGFYEETVRLEGGSDDVTEHGSRSRRRQSNKKTVKEKPGLLPGALFHLIENCLFLRLSDVESDLPPYDEHIVTMGMDTRIDDAGWSQSSAYDFLYQELYAAMVAALAAGSQRLLATYLQSLLAFPDGCTRGEEVYDPATKMLIAEVPPLDDKRQYPKERELVKLVKRERLAGRRVLVYVTHTGTRDITGRIADFLRDVGLNVSVLKSGSPKADAREEWVAHEVRNGLDVLICNPRLVQTGLDLIDFPSIVWYEVEYSVYTMRQASRRSWRIGQTQPVVVHYMTYDECLQADALSLVAAKMQSSLAVEGELPEEGLSAYGDSADNLMITLARQITGRMRGATGPTAAQIEEQFRQARELEQADETELVDSYVWLGQMREERLPEYHNLPRFELPEVPDLLPDFPCVPKWESNGHEDTELPTDELPELPEPELEPEPRPHLEPLSTGQMRMF